MFFLLTQIVFGPYMLPQIDRELFSGAHEMSYTSGVELSDWFVYDVSVDYSTGGVGTGDIHDAPQTGLVTSRFFDTQVDGFSDNWAWGHCTQYAAWYWWKHYEIKIPWRGNAGDWLANAQGYDRPTGDDPALGAFVIFDTGTQQRSKYGHVGVIVKIDETHRMMMIEDMNYLGTNMASHHWISRDDISIQGYIYTNILHSGQTF